MYKTVFLQGNPGFHCEVFDYSLNVPVVLFVSRQREKKTVRAVRRSVDRWGRRKHAEF